MPEEKPKVLILDTPDGIKEIQENWIDQIGERWEVIFSTSAKESFDIMQSREISVLVVSLCIKELDPVSLSHMISKEWPKVQVILNGSNKSPEKCKMTRQDFISSSAFDFVGEEQAEPEIMERIQVAIQARRMKDTGFY
jgi:DNA-binding NtrC family response regulator